MENNHPGTRLAGRSLFTGLAAGILSAVVSFTTPIPVQAQSTECHVHAGWADSDGDNIPDIIETAADLDGDGKPNYLDDDSDGDSLPDASEAWAVLALAGTDDNANGIDDTYDVADQPDPENDGVANERLPVDSDNDGIADYLDTDSDNDGLLDSEEINTTSSTTDADSDDDGLNDKEEREAGTAANNWDSDQGGVSDALELHFGSNPLLAGDDQTLAGFLDADNDGIANSVEGFGDADLDTIPDALDLDSDNDGWFDILEAGLPDADFNGQVDDSIDDDGNGMIDSVENLILVLPDSDKDGVPDQRDLDSDNDGLTDRTELADTAVTYRANLNPRDLDADGVDNRLDLDSDGDGLTDMQEVGYFDGDADGLVDLMRDTDNDGIIDSVDIDFHADQNDSDNDGIADQFDTDHSNETVTTTNWSTLEDEEITLPNTDIDGDGIVDRHDTDHDGDGLADAFSYFTPNHTDNDGDALVALHDNDDNSAFEVVNTGAVELQAESENRKPVLRPVDTYRSCDDVESTQDSSNTVSTEPENESTDSSETGSSAGDPLELGAGTSDEASNTSMEVDATTDNGGSGSGSLNFLAIMLGFMALRYSNNGRLPREPIE